MTKRQLIPVTKDRATAVIQAFLNSGLTEAICNRDTSFRVEPVERWIPTINALANDGWSSLITTQIRGTDLYLIRRPRH